jgi:hypothetical protein
MRAAYEDRCMRSGVYARCVSSVPDCEPARISRSGITEVALPFKAGLPKRSADVSKRRPHVGVNVGARKSRRVAELTVACRRCRRFRHPMAAERGIQSERVGKTSATSADVA